MLLTYGNNLKTTSTQDVHNQKTIPDSVGHKSKKKHTKFMFHKTSG
jgi:hypothetical protein